MKKLVLLIYFVVTLTFSSCVNTLTVTNDSVKVNGIPFYAQKAVVKQETKYLYDWIVISLLKEEKKENDKITTTPIITARITSGQNIDAIKKAVDNLNSDNHEQGLKVIIDGIQDLKVAFLHVNDIETDNIIENNWTIQTKVDYSTKYYLNSKIPWFGTSTLSQKLASNGTLSEATGTTDSQIDELAGVVAGLATPLSNINIARIENKDGGTLQENEIKLLREINEMDMDDKIVNGMLQNLSKEVVKYKLKTEEKGFIYTFKKTYELQDRDKANVPIEFNLKNGNYTRDNWPQEIKGVKNKDEKPTINVSGSIQLPNEKDKSVD